MSRVRNLQYNNVIVEQPYFDNVPLKKWIHDDVVVWENGGNFKNIYIIVYPELGTMYSMNPKDKKAYKLFDKYYFGMNTDSYVIDFSGLGYARCYLSDDYSTIGVLKAIPDVYRAINPYDSDTLIAIKKNEYTLVNLKIKDNNITEDIIGTIEMGDYFNTLKCLTYSNACASPNIMCMKSAEYTIDLDQKYGIKEDIVFARNVKNEGAQVIATKMTYPEGRMDLATGDSYDIRKRFDVNNNSFVVGIYKNRANTSVEWATQVGVIRSYQNFVISKHRKLMKNYDTADNFVTIKYDSTARQYLVYMKEGNTLHLHKSNEDLELLDEITVPDYIDVPIEDGASHTYSNVRVYLSPLGIIPETGTILASGVEAIAESVYFDNNGNASNSETIEMCLYINGTYIYVHIDNLYFNTSSDNYAMYI